MLSPSGLYKLQKGKIRNPGILRFISGNLKGRCGTFLQQGYASTDGMLDG
jgi:hypothetical protein